ncbi:hypothetical protein CPB83DRAFT_903530 [Crepidotus variabilis]|uniref:Rho1 guanine nucleotide exchange factor 1 n=1 Tax=Crepidotus variabilis TaxID=179855 RepID=A0A9P6EMG8_9AGAR|nr:hypothetical protein CPB83DRAFT_903530 [Crepidotus variabilis]
MYNKQHRPQIRPPPRLPPGAQQPALPSSSTRPTYSFPEASPYTFQVAPAEEYEPLGNPWDNLAGPPALPPKPGHIRPRSISQSTPYSNPTVPQIAFPEPQIQRSSSHLQSGRPQQRLSHHHSRSDLNRPRPEVQNSLHVHQNPSVASFASSYVTGADNYSYDGYEDYSPATEKGLPELSLESDEGLKSFQAGKLPEVDQAWHKLVPESAREALGKQEVQRQSVIFEVIKSELEYVADLEAVADVYIQPLREANPPILAEPALSLFIQEVFGNFQEILSHHKKMLDALLARQREQHPLLQSVADIILDTTLKFNFRSAYETYVKHYPLAESHHRSQLKQNRAYEKFIFSNADDPRIRKRDLVTFLSRPVTRLPRLNLLLETTLKMTETEHGHPDMETLPIILGILKDTIKSTQPGIEAAESKVKFWQLCESLVYQKGEIIDMDLYDESRSLVYTGGVMRRSKSETGLTEKWTDLSAALLDNYFILTTEEKRPNGHIKRLLVSRPMPLSFLRLGEFDGPAENRKEKNEDRSLLDSFRSQTIPVYPFTIYHAANRSTRRYTLYVTTHTVRKKWKNAFDDAIGVHKVRQEANMWFSPHMLTDGFFRTPRLQNPMLNVSKVTGKIQCATPFTVGGKRYLAVGCGPGVYVGAINSEQYHWALNHRNPIYLAALTTMGPKTFNRLVVHVDTSLYSYSLGIMAQLAQQQARPQNIESSIEKLADDANVAFCRYLHIGNRALLIYGAKRRLTTTMNLHALEAVDSSEQSITPKRSNAAVMRSFRTFGEYGSIPKDAYDAVPLQKSIGICTKEGIVTANPTNLASSSVNIVPDFGDSNNNPPMAALKANVGSQRSLGFVRVDPNELLVIYEELGCYINKHGIPTRKSGFVKWDAKATSYANRNGHVLLFSSDFIEIRNITTGRIVQVIEGTDIRLLYTGPIARKDDPVLVVMKGTKLDQDGQSEKIEELLETEEISVLSPTATAPAMWDEWDMS